MERDGIDLSSWGLYLGGLPASQNLPLDHARPLRGTRADVCFPDILDAEQLHLLRATCSAAGVTLLSGLCAAFAALMSRYTGEPDVVFGLRAGNRSAPAPHSDADMKALVLRQGLNHELCFNEWLGCCQAALLAAESRGEVPIAELIQGLSGDGSTDLSAIGQLMLDFRVEPHAATEGGAPSHAVSSADILLRIVDSNDALSLHWNYSSELFEPDTIERLAAHFKVLLEWGSSRPGSRLRDLPLLTCAEMAQLHERWQEAERPFPSDIGIHLLFAQQARKTPDAIALVHEGARLSYSELDARANQVAHRLVAEEIAPGEFVGIGMTRSLEMVVAIYGILKAGCGYVPLDPDYPDNRLAHLISDSGAQVVLTHAGQLERFNRHNAKVIALDLADGALAASCRGALPILATSVDWARTPAYMIYTSGTTGVPKGVVVEHAPLVNRILWMQSAIGIDSSDRILQKTPFSFDVSVWEFFWPLITGATLVVARPDGHKSPEYLQHSIIKHGVTVLHFVPSMLSAMLDHSNLAACASLRHVICSGEALPMELQKRFFATGTPAQLHNLYGPTEATVDVTHWRCQPDTALASVPIGFAIDNVRLYVLDRYLNLQPSGVAGELYIGGKALARGYNNLPELTAACFIADPFSNQPNARMYKTGDLVKANLTGRVDYLGRTDDQVKIRGFRIELQEINNVLEADRKVAAACAVKVQERLMVFLKLNSGVSGTGDVGLYFRDYLAGHLPAFMIPHAFVFVEDFPLSSNGKIDRKKLVGMAPTSASPLPASELEHADPVRARLAAIWALVLRIRPEDIGDDSNFLELGGDPLLMLEVIGKAKRDNLSIGLADFARKPVFSSVLANTRDCGPTAGQADGAVGRGPSEATERFRDIWAEVLSLERAAVSDHMSFLELGGDSLLMLRVIAKAKQQGIEIDLKSFTASPYLATARLANGLADASPTAAPVPVAFDPDQVLRRSRVTPNHATPFQQGLLAYAAARGDDGRYLVQWKLPIDGEVDFQLFQEATRILVGRTELLRSRFEFLPLEEKYVRIPLHDCVPTCRNLDVSGLSDDAAARAVRDFMLEDKLRGFDPSVESLIRFALIRRREGAHELLATSHHVIVDGHSAALVVGQLLEIYSCLLAGEPMVEEPAGRAQFAAYEQWIQRQDMAEARGYWRERLLGVEPTLLQLTREARSADTDARFAELRRSIPVPERTLQLLGREGVSLSAATNTLLGMLLARFNGSNGFVWGNAVSHRPEDLPDAGRIIGPCLGTVPVSVDFFGDGASLLERCREVQLQVLQSRENCFLSLADMFSAAGCGNLFNVLFSFQNHRPETSSSSDGGPDLAGRAVISAHFPLTFAVSHRSGRLEAQVSFSERVISERQVAAIVARLELLFSNLGGLMHQPCRSIDIHDSLHGGVAGAIASNESDRRLTEGSSLASQYRAAVGSYPDRTALLDSDGRRISYLQLDGMVNHLAARLANTPEAGTVGIRVDRSYRMVVAVLAVVLSGRSFVSLEKEFPEEKLLWIKQDMKLAALITDQPDQVLDAMSNIACLQLMDDSSCHDPVAAGDAEDPGQIFSINYTSGSTGQPKLVLTDQLSHLNRLQWLRENFPATDGDVFCLKTKLAFAPAMREIFEPLTQGAALYIFPEDANQNLDQFTAQLEQNRVSRVFMTPSFLRTLLESGLLGRLSHTRLLEISGEPVSTDLVAKLKSMLPGTLLLNRYGATEAASVVYSRLDDEVSDSAIAPLGTPISNTSVHIVDDHMRVLPRGVVGEILLSSASVARGYSDSRQDHGCFVPLATNGRTRAFRTGDLGYMDEAGRLFYVGRKSRMLKVRGYRVEPAEIELALEAHPSVQRAQVVAVEADHGSRLVACWTAHGGSGARATDLQLREYLRDKLPTYMLPSAFVQLASMPVTSSGKVDFVELARAASATRIEGRGPLDAVESYLVDLVASRLGQGGVDIDADLFSQGFDSLTALQLVHTVSEKFGRNLSISALYQHSTIALFAEYIRKQCADSDVSAGGNYLSMNHRPGNEMVFLFPPAGGGPFIYTGLDGKLPGSVSIVAFESPLYGKAEALYDDYSLTRIAHSYLAQIELLSGGGPVHLCGYSLGGTIAYEVACLLSRRQVSVSSLVLIDPGFSLPAYDERLNEQTLARLVDSQLGDSSRGNREATQSVRRLYRDSLLIRDYQPTAYGGDVTLIKPENVGVEERNYSRPLNGLEGLVGGDITVVRVPGNHMTMMSRHVDAVANVLIDVLAGSTQPAQALDHLTVGLDA